MSEGRRADSIMMNRAQTDKLERRLPAWPFANGELRRGREIVGEARASFRGSHGSRTGPGLLTGHQRHTTGGEVVVSA